ncbi:hypothetical protein [Micromonospora ureilytica]|uniref:Uncharacterized protein n=1 Tax=Micromonospora ureilytica TaxID=709868 RepID=A0ABS0JDR5_9ACTN|nr:hypothetical protein [Micromonospora ureilytica]MBG6065207.1 hypothetical protein [Micromonospora ureilytica]
MIIERPMEHSIMPMFLQAHAAEEDLQSPADIDMYMRVSALHCQSLTIVDSDLNNANIFHQAAKVEGGVFWTALRTGFIRRAARLDAAGSPVTQAAVVEGFRRVSPERVAKIEEGYLRLVDSVCQRNEHASPPLTWSLTEVNKHFLRKLETYVEHAVANRSLPTDHAIFDQVWEAVRNHRRAGTPLSAADIEARFRPRDYETSEEWNFIWRLVLDAQSGNVPLVYDGQLAITTTPRSADKFLPAGPTSAGVEREVEAELYRGGTKQKDRPKVTVGAAGGDRLAGRFVINRERLAALRLEEIEELREEALGANYFQARFDATGSSTDMSESAVPYSTTLFEYHERLARVGILRTQRREEAAVKETLSRVVVTAEKYGRTLELIMQTSTRLPVAEHNIVMCDSQTIRELLGPTEARKILPDDNALWMYRRPDCRVLEWIPSP